MNADRPDEAGLQVAKRERSLILRLVALLASSVDPRAYLHFFRLLNYYNNTHVRPRRIVKMGEGVTMSPDVVFSNPERIEIGARTSIGSRCHIWAGPSRGRILLGADCLLGPEVLLTAANYRFNDGSPVTKQKMDEADILIGRDVWFGARAIVLPGVTIGDGCIVGAGAIVNRSIAAGSIAVGAPARIVGQRDPVYPGAEDQGKERG